MKNNESIDFFSWPNMAGLSTLQSGLKGSESDQNGQPKCPFGAKKSFLSKMVQKGPDGPKMGPK